MILVSSCSCLCPIRWSQVENDCVVGAAPTSEWSANLLHTRVIYVRGFTVSLLFCYSYSYYSSKGEVRRDIGISQYLSIMFARYQLLHFKYVLFVAASLCMASLYSRAVSGSFRAEMHKREGRRLSKHKKLHPEYYAHRPHFIFWVWRSFDVLFYVKLFKRFFIRESDCLWLEMVWGSWNVTAKQSYKTPEH